MWLGLVYLVTLCVFDTSADVRLKRSLFGEVRVCRPASISTQNSVLLSVEPPRALHVSGSYRGQELNPPQNVQDFRENPEMSQYILENNPNEKHSRCARSIKDTYDRWDSGRTRNSKPRWSSRSARDSEIIDDEDDEGYEDKALSSLPKGRYLLIPTSSNLEDILKSKDPHFKTNTHPATTVQQVRRNSEGLAQDPYEVESLGFQTETPPSQQVPAFDQNCPHCNKMPSSQKTMSKQPMDPKHIQQLLQTNPSFVKKFLEENSQIRQRRFSGYDRKADSPTVAEKVNPISDRIRSKTTPKVNSKPYQSPRNVVGKLNKPNLHQVPSKKSILELFPKHILQEIQSQVPRSIQPTNNIRKNVNSNFQSSQLPQNQRTNSNQNSKYPVHSQPNEFHSRQNVQMPSLSSVGHGNPNFAVNPARNPNLSSIPKGLTMPTPTSNPVLSTVPSRNRMPLPNPESPELSRFPTTPSPENSMPRRPQEPRTSSNPQVKINPPTADVLSKTVKTSQVPARTAPNGVNMSRNVDVFEQSLSLQEPESAPAPSTLSGSGAMPTQPARHSSSVNAGSNLSEAPTNSAKLPTFQDVPIVTNIDFIRQESTDIKSNSK